MAWDPAFEVAFNPRAVAIVGVSRKPRTFDFLTNLQRAGFAGRIYPINPNAAHEEHRGLTFYPTVASVPEPVDLVIVTTPPDTVPAVLEDCIAANARNVHIFTAGFREVGDERGRELERRVVEIARKGGLRIVGPNCMGLQVPASRLTTWESLPEKSGSVALITQSGGISGEFLRSSGRYGIYISKAISFGNAAVLGALDFLEYLATDPETRLICAYLEGVTDGSRFTSLVREVNKEKPVIIWKGGLTESGARAVASHTGSLGGQREVWDAFFRQTGAVRVESLPEMLDAAMTFLYLRPFSGRRVAVMGVGGGNTVAGADVCARAGLEVPKLGEDTVNKLRSFLPREGTIIGNPLDLGVVNADIALLFRSLDPFVADPVIDAVIFSVPVGGTMAPSVQQAVAQAHGDSGRGDVAGAVATAVDDVLSFAREHKWGRKPLVLVLEAGGGGFSPGMRALVQERMLKEGVPVYLSLERASKALSKFVKYHERQATADAE